MAEFTVHAQRFDPYENFKSRLKCKVSAIKHTTEVVKHREGGDPSSSRKSRGRTEIHNPSPGGIIVATWSERQNRNGHPGFTER